MITDELNTVLDWNKLSMRDRAAFIRLAVANGYKDVDSIRNLYKEGGDKNSNLKKLFLTLLDSSLLNYSQYNTPLWRRFFTDLALLESSFKPNILNDIGAKGYFQLMPYNRSASWNSPTLLFHEMYKLVGANEKTLMKKLTDNDVQKAYNMGIDWFGLLAGAHLGGVGNVIKALRGQGNAKDKNNASVLGYMKQFSQGVIPTRNDALYTIKPDATYTAPIYPTIDTTEHTPVNNITIDTNEDKPIENDNSYRGLIENVSPEVHTGFIPIQQEYMSYAAPMLVLPVLQQQPKVQYEPLNNTSLLLKDLEYTILNGLYANDLEKENLKEDLRFLLNISANGGRLYQKGSWLKNKLYNFLSNTGGTVRINAGKYTGSYHFGKDYSNATDIKYGGERADTTRNPLALYLGVDTIGMNKLRHDKYILDNDTIDADFFEGKILPEKKDGKPYILQSKLKPEFDALIDNNRTFLMNMNEFPFDPNLYNEQTLDNVRNVRVKPIKDDKGNYFLKLTKLWDLTGSLTGGSTTDWLNEKAGGRPPVLEQIVPMKFEDEYTKENYYINRARELAGNPKAYGGFFNKFAPGGGLNEEYLYTTTYLPEVTITPTRLQREQAWRKREGNIAKSLVSHPTLPNLFSAVEHYANSIPGLFSAPSEITGITASEPLLPDVKNAAQLMKVGKIARAIEDAVKTGKNSFRTAVSNIFKKPAKKPDIIWDAEQMFKDGNNFSYTQKDIDILNSFIPEYKEIEKLSKANGTYLKMPDGSTWKGDPREWVIAQSKNVKDNYGSEILTHGNSDSWITKEGTDVTGDILGEKTLWTSTNPYLGGTYGNKRYRFVVPKDAKVETVADAHGRYWRDVKPGVDTNMMVYPNLTEDKIIRINNVVDRGPNEFFKEELPKAFPKEGVMDYTARVFQGDDLVLGNKVRRKALLGNNGIFDINNPNIFKGLIPAGFGIAGYKYSKSNENK